MGAAGFWKKVKNFFGKVGDGIGKGLKAIGQLGQKIADKIPDKSIFTKALKYGVDKISDVGVRTGEHLSDISKNGSSKQKWKNYYNDLKDIAPASVFTAPARLVDAIKGGKNGLKNEFNSQMREVNNLLTGNTTNSDYDRRSQPNPVNLRDQTKNVGQQLLHQGLETLLKNKL